MNRGSVDPTPVCAKQSTSGCTDVQASIAEISLSKGA
jgi:hypothetical protein